MKGACEGRSDRTGTDRSRICEQRYTMCNMPAPSPPVDERNKGSVAGLALAVPICVVYARAGKLQANWWRACEEE